MTYPRIRDFPKTVEIRGKTWQVNWRRTLLFPGYEDVHGLCHYGSRTIELAMGHPPKERLQTFVHELLHAFSYEFGIPRLDHNVIEPLEIALVAFLADNGMLPFSKRSC